MNEQIAIITKMLVLSFVVCSAGVPVAAAESINPADKKKSSKVDVDREDTDNYKGIIEHYTKAAERGDADAQYLLGFCFYTGRGFPVNHQKATEWFSKSAQQGHLQAQYKLGQCYRDGRGVPEDDKEAMKWFTLCAKQEYALAQLTLATCYLHGIDVLQDVEEAVRWYRLSATQGNTSALNNLGISYKRGRGVAVDFEEAVQWYKKAAKLGDGVAQENVALCYWEGEGVGQNYIEALAWSLVSDKWDDSGLRKDLKEKLTEEQVAQARARANILRKEMLVEISERGTVDSDAAFWLHQYYEITAEDYTESLRWLDQAASLGHPVAIIDYNIINKRLKLNFDEECTNALKRAEPAGGPYRDNARR